MNKVSVFVKIQLVKTVPRYLYSVTLSTFTPSVKIYRMTKLELFSNQSAFPLFSLHSIPAPVAEPFNFSKINNLNWKDLLLRNHQRAFMTGVVSVPVQSFV